MYPTYIEDEGDTESQEVRGSVETDAVNTGDSVEMDVVN